MYRYRNLKNGQMITAEESDAPDWNEWEQISEREYQQSGELAALEAENAELRAALQDLRYLAIGSSIEEMTSSELADTLALRVSRALERK